jgi:hypothetical protein
MKIKKRIAALALAGAMVAGGLAFAQSALAAPISGGTLTITPTSGNVNTDVVFLNSLQTNVGGPAGFRTISGLFVYQAGVKIGSIATVRTPSTPSTYGTFGLDGNAGFADRSISPTNNFVSNKLLNDVALSGLVSGQFELRNYWFASATTPDYANDPYVSLQMTYNSTTGAWSVYAAPIATTVSLTAGASGTTVSLSATVKKASDSSTATAAVGNIVFKDGSTTVATVAVASGVASTSLVGVSNGSHTYTAQFAPTDSVYDTSTSGGATVTVGGVTGTTTINVTIPTGVGSLTLTGVPTSVNLGTAVLGGGTLNASGTLGPITVTDTRQLGYPAWSLTGQVGDFSDGTHTLNGKYLGWTPALSGTGNAGVAGPAVAAGTGNGNTGLKTVSVLASGSPVDGVPTTAVSAALALAAPANTPAGAYSATLTVTLI